MKLYFFDKVFISNLFFHTILAMVNMKIVFVTSFEDMHTPLK
ncbi:hypothetical protein XBKQ1_2880013 [Xenorhabdus bovienii str. kraussei Quebec]|uniref:Uncharacterized protein n=1 Tax=Xenorhabdus bovienii str. kraussei Quebec TaxID=1398203 RepID=A0A077PIX0_XENBV|nr:hypothetical protein XBKQ1_2880013 [Xenorhabdus bovienii str. kraussei Quebec]